MEEVSAYTAKECCHCLLPLDSWDHECKSFGLGVQGVFPPNASHNHWSYRRVLSPLSTRAIASVVVSVEPASFGFQPAESSRYHCSSGEDVVKPMLSKHWHACMASPAIPSAASQTKMGFHYSQSSSRSQRCNGSHLCELHDEPKLCMQDRHHPSMWV